MMNHLIRNCILAVSLIILSAFAGSFFSPASDADSPLVTSASSTIPLRFDRKMNLRGQPESQPETPAITADPTEDAEALAQRAWDLRYSRLDIALHMMSRALQLDDSEEIRQLATDLVKLTAYELAAEWEVNGEGIKALALSPDGRFIAVGNSDGSMSLLSQDGEAITGLVAHESAIDGLAFSPDGTLLAAGSHDDYFTLWQVGDGSLELVTRHFYGSDWVRDLTFSPDGAELYVAGDLYYSLVFQVSSQTVSDTLGGHDYYVYAIDRSPSGATLISGDGDGLLKSWNRENGDWVEAGSFNMEARINDLQFISEERALASLGNGVVYELNLDNPANIRLRPILTEAGQDLAAVASLQNGIIAGGDGSRLEFILDGKQGTVPVEDYVSELLSVEGETFLVAVGSSLVKGVVRMSGERTIASLKAGENLPELALADKLTYNLWSQEDLADLKPYEQSILFRTIAEVNEGYAWEKTDLDALNELFGTQALSVLSEFLDGSQEETDPVSALIRNAGAIRGFSSAVFGMEGKAAKALQWIAIGSHPGTPIEIKRLAARKAYQLFPSDTWARLLANGLGDAIMELSEPDQELTFGCDANSVSFSPNGAYLFVTTDRAEDCDGGYLYPVRESMPVESQGISFPNQNNIIWQGAFSADGQRIASASSDGTVIVYNLYGSPEQIFVNEGGEVPFNDARILRNGDVVTADNNGAVLLWKMGSIQPSEVLIEQASEARKIAVLPDGASFLTVGFDGLLYIYRDGEVEEVEVHYDGLEDVSLSQDGQRAVMGHVGGGASIYDFTTGELQRIADTDGIDFQSVAFVPGGQTLFAGTEAGYLKAFDAAGSLMWEKRIHDGPVYDLAISPDGATLAAAGGDDRVSLWRVAGLGTEKNLWTTQPWDSQIIPAEEWSTLLSVAGRSRHTQESRSFVQDLLDDYPKGESRNELEQAIESSLFFSLSGKTVKDKGGLTVYQVTGQGLHGISWSDSRKHVVGLGSGGALYDFQEDGSVKEAARIPDEVESRCFVSLKDGGWAVASPGEVRILDQEYELRETISLHEESTIYDIAISADGKTLATASADNNLALINVSTLEAHLVRGHENEANAVAFFQDGSGLVSGADDAAVNFWSMEGELLKSVTVGANVWSLAVSKDGDRIVAGTNEGEIILLDRDGEELKRWFDDTYALWAVSFSPDGKRFASGDNNGSLFVYDRDGEFQFSFNTGDDSIFEITWSPDGKFLFVSTTEGELYRLEME